MRGAGSRRAAAITALAVAAWTVAAWQPVPGSAASTTWTFDVTPTSIEAADETTIKATFSNLGGPSGTDDLGCVRIVIPATFTVVPPLSTQSPPKTSWQASGTNTVFVHPSSGGDRLPPDAPSLSVTVSIPVISVVPGTFTWAATAYASQDCTKAFPEQIKPTVTVHLLPTAPPAPTPTPSPTPTPTPPPTPTATPTPTPTPTPVVIVPPPSLPALPSLMPTATP